MTESDYKYIENRLNQMCRHKIKIIYDKNNSKRYYELRKDNIMFDNIVLKIYKYGSHKLSISKKITSYNTLISLLYNKYLEVIK